MTSGVITEALQGTSLGAEAPNWLLWYVANGTEIYAQVGSSPNTDEDIKVGEMIDSPLAEEAVTSHNEILKRVQRV